MAIKEQDSFEKDDTTVKSRTANQQDLTSLLMASNKVNPDLASARILYHRHRNGNGKDVWKLDGADHLPSH